MCGIAAIYSQKPIDMSFITRMTDIIKHRGPDGEGHMCFFENHFWMGHRRLSIVDLSSAGHQPMSYRNERYWITYNGGVYNYIELRSELESLGHVFYSKTDTEVVLAAYAQWGEHCLQRFNGAWAFVILDTQEKKVFAARDRFGAKPFYYGVKEQLVGFASEIKQLCEIGFGKRYEKAEVAKFLLYGDVNLSRKTCFDGVFQLLNGEALMWNIHEGTENIRIWKYYDPEFERSMKGKKELSYYQEKFNFLFEDSVRLRLRSDVEVGSCLSGGMDSSSIVTMTKKLITQQGAGNSQKTFTSCFEDPRFDEWQFAEEVVNSTNVEAHRVFPNMNNLFQEIEDLIWYQEEPFRSTSIFAQWNVMRLAHEKGIKVLLDGQGADEVMSGYHYYIPMYLASTLKTGNVPNFLSSLSSMKRTGILSATESSLRILMKTGYYLSGLKQLRVVPIKSLLNSKYQNVERFNSSLDFQSYTYHDIFGRLQSLLRHEDRNSMTFSVEARTPFLDYRLVELFLNMPGEYKIRDGWTKPFLREAMKGSLPNSVRLRTDKKGFETPEILWYRENYQKIKEELLCQDSHLYEWIDRDKFREWFEHPNNPFKQFFLWRLLSVHYWIKRFGLSG
ncbi:asparagine synthase (glutamine-hydrolyzing) [Bacillus sp. FJAT-29790]|uniref:asparagine synthase (glutamine-hydrolyzing) n=1 Tax=Bacillus sp. FJAT-29790 TaxID=1895002 RepID=UPI001C23D10A|nr:asparagine synthase (glutamine-hydrolyzing) [Bacillus sp. FJAT-29790]MBU8880798.1 asparagine synthase (glutamine-hydrolyzing) [Bacillus sp. FJAT-29790]